MTPFRVLTLTAALAAAAAPAFADDHQGGMPGMNMQGSQNMQDMPGMSKSNMGPMMGSHMMQATVTAVDTKTGLVDVTAGGMALKLHFPPASLAGVKTGDTITLHLAFSKP